MSILSTQPTKPLTNVAPAASRARYWVVVFAVTLAIIQYIDRVCVSQAKGSISDDLKLDDAQMGWVFSAFTLAYALFEIPAGYLGDRIGPRKVLLRIVLWWSFFTMATGWMWSWASLLVTRFLFGAGEAGAFPNLTKAFKRWLPLQERTRAQGIMWTSARLGGAFTPALVALCLHYVSWRHAFLLFGGLGIVWAVIFFWWYRDDPKAHQQVNAAEAALLPTEPAQSAHFSVPWRLLFTSRTVWCLCGQYFACSYSFYFFITWFPTYLLKAHGLDLKQSAILAGTPLFVGAFGSLFAGWLMPVLARRFGNMGAVRRGVGAAGAAGAALALVLATTCSNPYLAVAGIALGGFCNDIQMPGAWTACMDVGGKSVATLAGTMNMMGNVGGFLSPIVCGYIVRGTGNWNLALYVMAAVYVTGIFFWLGIDPVTPLEKQAGCSSKSEVRKEA
jgi:MFS family permease